MRELQSERAHCSVLLCVVAGLLAGCGVERPTDPNNEGAYGALSTAGSAASAYVVNCGSRGLPPCAADEYCRFSEAASCGDADVPGVCTPRPRFCPRIFKPVCGCDGQTYANACTAAAAGSGVRSQGACPNEHRTCGGLLGLRCAEGEYCDFAPEAQCGRADATGTCAPKPEFCTREFRPVCGCDGVTYPNPCSAAAAGVSVESEGACPSTGEICGGLLGIGCPEGQYCDFAAGDGCDVADGQGVCTDQPEICTEQFDPVCGCDGTTYGNACLAAASGVSVRAPGECAR